MIEADGLTKQFDDFLAVDGVSLNVQAGEVLALLGPNGAGKTTTVRMLTSVLRPTRGRARVAGYDVVQHPARVRAAVGVLTEQHGLYGRMNAQDYLEFFGQIYRIEKTVLRQKVNQYLTTFGLDEARFRQIGEYSKGMRQKLALARAMLHEPPVLLLDEPTSAMDPESARLVRDSLASLRSAKRAIVLCTHNLLEAEELADQIAIIRRGKIVARGSPGELKERLLGLPEYEVRLAFPLKSILSLSKDRQRHPEPAEGLSQEQRHPELVEGSPQEQRYPELVEGLPLPAGISLTSQGENWFRFRSEDPLVFNPRVLEALVARQWPVVSLHEVPRSLERVYLQAVQAGAAPDDLTEVADA